MSHRSTSPIAATGEERALLAFLRRADYRPLPQRQLLHRMNISQEQRPVMRRVIRHLLDEGKMIKIAGGRLVAAPSDETTTGTLHRHRDGFGFVVPDGGGDDVFIPPGQLGGTLSGDRVVARVTRLGRQGRPEGIIVETMQPRSRRVLGVMNRRGRFCQVFPFDSTLRDPIRIPTASHSGAAREQVVQIEILRTPEGGRPAEGKVLETLGHLDEQGVDVAVVVGKYGLAGSMPADVVAEAEQLPRRVRREEVARRSRFDDPDPVTIDGETARDFDDAIAVVALPRGRFRLFVHIADVARFVAPGSALDREALRRGTSVYFPDRVIPMLPERLSNDLCSLRPGVDRLVQSVILDIAADGSIERSRFTDGVIRSAARLTYTQVAAVLEGQARVRGVPARVVPMLQVAGRLRAALEARRQARGSIDFDLPEPRILLDVEGAMTGVTIEPRNEAHRLIEECMLAANEAVAAHLEQRGHPCMFRVHDPPDPAKLELLGEFVSSLGIRSRLAAAGGLAVIQALLEAVEGRPEARVIGLMALRSMKQARYSMENTGHFGLAAPTYCHFTSPIRRYPDLVVHRLLRSSRAGRGANGRASTLDAVARDSSELERNAEAAERELLEWKKLAFIRDQVGERFAGVVTAVVHFGLFVQLNDNLVEGLLRVDRLGEERFEYDESRQELRGAHSGRRFRLGDRLTVRIDRVDRVLRRVDFSLAGAPAARRRSAETASSRRRPVRRAGRRERTARGSRSRRG